MHPSYLPVLPKPSSPRSVLDKSSTSLKETDKYKHFDDSIGAICDFDRADYLYEMPYGTMIKSGFPNLITVGRTTSGEGYGWDVLRVIPPAILTGQAAGAAVAQAIETQTGLLRILFDTMLNTSITMIKENSDAMHKYMMATVGQTSVSSEKSGDALDAQGQVAKMVDDSSKR